MLLHLFNRIFIKKEQKAARNQFHSMRHFCVMQNDLLQHYILLLSNRIHDKIDYIKLKMYEMSKKKKIIVNVSFIEFSGCKFAMLVEHSANGCNESAKICWSRCAWNASGDSWTMCFGDSARCLRAKCFKTSCHIHH